MGKLEQAWAKYGKSIVATVAAVIMAVQAAASDHQITRLEWIQIASAAVTAVGVWWLPDHPNWGGVKIGVAVLTAFLAALTTVVSQGLTSGSWPDILIGALTVLFVGAAPSKSMGASAPKVGG